MVSVAAVTAASLGTYWAVRSEGLPLRRVVLAMILIAMITLVGGRLHFVLANWQHLRSPLTSALRLSSGSLHAPGAILGAVLGSVLVLRFLKLPLARFADGLAPAVGIGIAIARVGCLLHGCCYGEVCDLPWGISLSTKSYVYAIHLERGILPPNAAASLPVHPLPLYFSAAGLSIAAILVWMRRRKSFDGQLALTLLFLFSASSAALEPLRIDDATRVYWGSLPQLQWVTAVMAVAFGVALVFFSLIRRPPQHN